MYGRGGEVAVPPRIGGSQWSTPVESTLWGSGDHGAGRAVVLGGVLAWRRSRWRRCGSSGRHGRSCRGYRPLCATWRCLEGPAGGSHAPVKAWAALEGCAHADRGFPGGESTRKVRGVGSTVARAVPGTSCTGRRRFPQCRHSVRDGGAVTGVGGWDPSHSHCAEWWSDAV